MSVEVNFMVDGLTPSVLKRSLPPFPDCQNWAELEDVVRKQMRITPPMVLTQVGLRIFNDEYMLVSPLPPYDHRLDIQLIFEFEKDITEMQKLSSLLTLHGSTTKNLSNDSVAGPSSSSGSASPRPNSPNSVLSSLLEQSASPRQVLVKMDNTSVLNSTFSNTSSKLDTPEAKMPEPLLDREVLTKITMQDVLECYTFRPLLEKALLPSNPEFNKNELNHLTRALVIYSMRFEPCLNAAESKEMCLRLHQLDRRLPMEYLFGDTKRFYQTQWRRRQGQVRW